MQTADTAWLANRRGRGDNQAVRVCSRVCVLVCLAGGVLVARSAAASMTIVYRDNRGETVTFAHDGDRVRLTIGTDDGAAHIIDLKSKQHVVVYDNANAYFDQNKAMAAVGAALERAGLGGKLRRELAKDWPLYRPLGKTRTVNGFSCAMYELVVARRVEAEVCLAPWGNAVGAEQDFAWLDATMAQAVEVISGHRAPRAPGKTPGLRVWSSEVGDDGRREVTEVIKLSRDPLPAAMFQIPAGYEQISRPLTASERPPRHDSVMAPASSTSTSRGRISGVAMILLGLFLLVVVLIQAGMLHFAAGLVLDRPLFRQALVAMVIVWLATLIGRAALPTALAVAVDGLAVLAGLKISYGASLARTIVLFVVSGMLALLAGYGFAIFLRLLGPR
jgi:hypothetical protein